MSGPCWPPLPRPETCLHGGTCSANLTVCVCPPGYSSDDMIFHNQNCGLPDNALVGFAVYYSILSFLVGLLLVRECRNTINLAKRLGALSFSLLVIGWLMVIVSVTERGYFEGIAFLCFVVESLCASLAYHLFLAFVIPLCTIYRVPHKRIKFWIKRWSILLSGPFFAFFVALAYYSRGSNETFNWVQAAHCLFILVGNSVFVSALIYHSRNLTRVLAGLSKSNMPSRRMREVHLLEQRTTLMMYALSVFLFLVVVSITAIVCMVLAFGSAPFAWVFAMIVVHFSVILGLGIAVFLRQRRDAGDRSSIGIVVYRHQPGTDVPGDDYRSWTKTNTNTKHMTSPQMGVSATPRTRNGHDSGAIKAFLEDGSMVPITEHSDDGAAEWDPQQHNRSSMPAKAYRSVVASGVSESDRVVRRDRGVVIQSSQAPSDFRSSPGPSSVKSFHESEIAPRSSRISGRGFSTLSSRRGDVASSVFQSEAEGDNRTRSLQRGRKRGIFASRFSSNTPSRMDEDPDF